MWALAHACATAPRRVTEPPAFSIASTADFDAPWTWKDSFAWSSPTPRIFTPSRGLETTPAATSVSTVTAARIELAGLDGLLDAADIDLVQLDRVRLVEAALRQTTVQRHLTAFEALDGHAGTGLLSFTPRPPVLPLPEPIPRPTRMRFLVEPSLSRISLSFMTLSSLPVDNAHEVLDLFDHAADRRRVFQGRSTVKLVELETDQRLTLLGLTADRRTDLLNGDGALC